ncbi:MAG: hypothetical protein ACRD8Z_04950 [Nitrososphaeraceae archaeon]
MMEEFTNHQSCPQDINKKLYLAELSHPLGRSHEQTITTTVHDGEDFSHLATIAAVAVVAPILSIGKYKKP